MVLVGTLDSHRGRVGRFPDPRLLPGPAALGKSRPDRILNAWRHCSSPSSRPRLLSNLFPEKSENQSWSNYAMTKDGAVFKVTQDAGRSSEIVDLEGKPILDAKTGRKIELGGVQSARRREPLASQWAVTFAFYRLWTQADTTRASPWHATADTLWYYWTRYGRLVGYDVATRRFIGSLGPNGFAQDLSGGGDRFSNSAERLGSRTLSTATTLYQVDPEQRATKPLFTTTSDDPILATTELMPNEYDWEYTAVVTKRSIHLLTAEGKPVWKVPYEPKEAACGRAEIYFLEPPGHFVLWLTPSYWENNRANWKLPIHVAWLARDQGVVRSAEVPSLAPPPSSPGRRKNWCVPSCRRRSC